MVGEIALDAAFSWPAANLGAGVKSLLSRHVGNYGVDIESADAAQLIAAIAQAWQCAGEVTPSLWRIASRDEERRSVILYFGCMDPFLGAAVLAKAVQLVHRLTRDTVAAAPLSSALEACAKALEAAAVDQSTRGMIEAAEARDIPWFRMNRTTRHIQLGQGERQRRIRETLTSTEGSIGREIARNKILALATLSQIGLPVGKLAQVSDLESALKMAGRVGYPLVLKPTEGMKGRFVYANLRNADELRQAAMGARIDGRQFLLQSFFPGDDHRILVVSGKLIAAARRIAASVTGNGRHSVAELVDIENRNPLRGDGFAKLMNRIVLDSDSDGVLARQGYARDSVLPDGMAVRVKSTANISTGGTSADVTATIHPDNARVAIRAAKALGATVVGVDFICPDISKSWREVGGGICEVNFIVGVRPHQLANPDFDVLGPIVESLYPAGENGRIPTAMVTGTVGKSTTCAMLAAILATAGHNVGSATTEGVWIGEEEIARGDFAGANGASLVLRDATVTAAVLETARGGLLKSGMYLDRCDVAALLNVRREHLEVDGINTIAEMAALKRKVLDAARRAVVLNAEDTHCAAMAPEFATKVRTLLFSRDPAAPVLRQHLARDGEGLFLGGAAGEQEIVIAKGAIATPLVKINALPSTRNGLVWQNAVNAMVAAALALGMGLAPETIARGLMRYGADIPSLRGRFVFPEGFPLKIMFDFAGHAPALVAAVTLTDSIPVSGTRYCALALPGNRPDWQFTDCAAALAGHFDRYIAFDRDRYLRGRKPGEITGALRDALIGAGVDPAAITVLESPEAVADWIAEAAEGDDFAAIFGTDPKLAREQFHSAFAKRGRISPRPP